MQTTLLNGKSTFPFVSIEHLLDYISEKKKILIAINTEKILSNDSETREIINQNIGYPDGIGAIMALRRKGIQAVKIRGAELWLHIIRRFYKEKSFYLIGSVQEVIEKTVEKLSDEFPTIRIVNFHNGYFDDDGLREIISDIKVKKPDIIFVAMGSPKQERIMSKMIREYPALYMGLGGSYDLYCGKVKPVPNWWNRMFKWEGLYRAFNDFTNIKRWKRQIPAMKIIYRILFNLL